MKPSTIDDRHFCLAEYRVTKIRHIIETRKPDAADLYSLRKLYREVHELTRDWPEHILQNIWGPPPKRIKFYDIPHVCDFATCEDV